MLRDRLYDYLAPSAPGAEEGFEIEHHVLAPGGVTDWLATHASGAGRTGLHVHGSWGAGTGDVRRLALASADGEGVSIDPARITPEDEAALVKWLADSSRLKVLHDAKGPLLALAARGWPLAGLAADTELSAFIVLPGQRSYELSDLVLRFLNRELRSDDDSGDMQLSLDGGDEEQSARDDVVRARAVIDLADALDAELTRRSGRQLLDEVELPLVEVLVDMERAGIAIDIEHLSSLEAHFASDVKQAADAAYAAIGREVNLGSPKQLQVVLFDELQMPKTKRTKTGYTTDAEALVELYARTEHPFLEALLRHRDATKLRSTVEGLLKSVSDDGRIHTTFNQTIAATGRLSSTDPNLQNIPIRTDEGRRIRETFMVGPAYECLLTADYSQIEMRVMAHVSEDTALIEAFESGADFHATTAARVFGVPTDRGAARRCGPRSRP